MEYCEIRVFFHFYFLSYLYLFSYSFILLVHLSLNLFFYLSTYSFIYLLIHLSIYSISIHTFCHTTDRLSCQLRPKTHDTICTMKGNSQYSNNYALKSQWVAIATSPFLYAQYVWIRDADNEPEFFPCDLLIGNCRYIAINFSSLFCLFLFFYFFLSVRNELVNFHFWDFLSQR